MDVGKCACCAKRQKMIMPCSACTTKFCSSCIQLEVHACPNILDKKQAERDKLMKQNPVVVAPKVQRF